jgi:hypothetical protein
MGAGDHAPEKRDSVIRQAISCDVCGRDKQQTNHWFVVYEHGAELRISGWTAQARTSTRAKHLCGQTCLHKLVDDFMARTIRGRNVAEDEQSFVLAEERVPLAGRTDASLTSALAHAMPARAVAMPLPVPLQEDPASSARLISADKPTSSVEGFLPPARPANNSLARRAEAWRREQEREKRNTQKASARQQRSIA